MGKGRHVAAAIIHNYYAKGVKRAVWVSTSKLLIDDARRDMTALLPDKFKHSSKIQVEPLDAYKTSKDLRRFKAGVLFVTYNLLARDWKKKVQLLSTWLREGKDPNDKDTTCGTIILDER